MEHAQGARAQRVAQVVGEVEPELLRGEHALIDERAARQAREIKELVVVEPELFDFFLEPLANDVKLPLELVGIGDRGAAADEERATSPARPAGALAQRAAVGLDAPPAEELLAFLGHDPLEVIHAEFLLRFVRRGEERADAVMFGLGKLDPERPDSGRPETRGGSGSRCPRRRRYCFRIHMRRDG